MRIIQLIDTLDPGGAERMAVNLANTFEKKRIHNLLIVSRKVGSLGALIANQQQVKTLHKTKTTDLKAFRKLLQTIDQFAPDVFHAHGTSIYWGVVAKIFRPKIKLIWHDHLGISPEVIQSNPRKELKWMTSWIDFVIAANEDTKFYWESIKLKSADKIAYLANFPQLVEREKQKTDCYTFLLLANYRSEKGQLHVAKAAQLLKSRGHLFKVRMVGMTVDQGWKLKVAEYIDSNNLENEVKLEGPIADVAEVLFAADAGIIASDREGLPVAILEYGLASLPVISSRVGQCLEVLEDGKLGLLTSAGSVEELAVAMEKLLSNPEFGKNLGSIYRDSVRKRFGSEQFMEKYDQIIHSLLNPDLDD